MSRTPTDIDELFTTIREAAGPTRWSKGVDLARQHAVTGERHTSEEITMRVLAKEAGLSRSVALFPRDGDWTCNCSGPDDPCQHVCAAVIALKRAQEQGQALPQSAKAGAAISYALRRISGGLALERWAMIPGGSPQLLTSSLTALTSGRIAGPIVSPTQDDIAVDSALGHERSSLLAASGWRQLLPALKPLADRGELKLDDKPVRASGDPVGLQVSIVDDGPGVKLFAEQDKEITELFSNGVALCGETLRPLVLPSLNPLQRELLRLPRFYGPREFGELAGDILPPLRQVMKLDIRSNKLPGMTHADVGIEILLKRQLNTGAAILQLTARLVYHKSDVVIASLHAGRLIVTSAEVPTRQLDAEHLALDQLSRALSLRPHETQEYSGSAAVAMIERLMAWEKRSRHHFLSGDGLRAFQVVGSLQAAVQIDEHDFDLSFKLASDNPPKSYEPGESNEYGAPELVTTAAVLQAWRHGESLVPLTTGGFAQLPLDWLTRFGPTIESLLHAKALGGSLPRSLIPTLNQMAEAMQIQVNEGLRRFAAAVTSFVPTAPSLELRIQTELRPYQKIGIAWLAHLQALKLGGVLADDMGLGKTVQTLASLQGRCLVVAPTSVLANWQREAGRFRPDLTVQVYHGAARELDTVGNQQQSLVLTTYALLRRDLSKLKTIMWSVIVLDEAQAIKNPDSQVSQAAFELQGDFKLCLSGTPVENSLDDAWSLFHFACPGLLGDRDFFTKTLSKPIYAGDNVAAASLRERIKPFFLRRLKRDVAPDLPARTEMVLEVELTEVERQSYEAIKAATRADVIARLEAGGNVLMVLEALLRLRQAACHLALLPGQKALTSSKLELLVSTLSNVAASGHKALVFSQWTSFLDLIAPALQAASLKTLRLDGTTINRGEVVEAFQTGGTQVLMMSLKAGGVGLNLTAADHVFILDPWWNPAAEDQAADRAHRIGQDKPVMVYRLVATGTVEERILALQDKKRRLAEAVTGTSMATPSSGLTRQDLLELLR